MSRNRMTILSAPSSFCVLSALLVTAFAAATATPAAASGGLSAASSARSVQGLHDVGWNVVGPGSPAGS
ncbi:MULTISPECIES: hypothetical protein [unclassified Streptomyces]|uniref:hypothetical protein n=1 Tax=unclassified Streptomyces TaxID=2593676 RepID=UPI001113DA5F|nr:MULTISPECIES: hypothetical protein [unclassified Streptomyces]